MNVVYTAASINAKVIECWEEDFELDMTGIVLPEYETENGSFDCTDSYVVSQGFYLVLVSGTNENELLAYLAALQEANWDVQYKQGQNGYYYAVSYNGSGEVPCFEIQIDDLEDGDVYILYYSTFKIAQITAEAVIANICSMVGSEVVDLGDGWFGTQAAWGADLETVKGWCENIFTPDSFEMITDGWEEDVLGSGDNSTPCIVCVFYDAEADVVIEYYLYVEYYEQYQQDLTCGVFYAYPGGQE